MNQEAFISIVIPVLNEEDCLGRLLPHLKNADTAHLIKEIIVIDGGSKDRSCLIAQEAGATVIHSSKKSRAIQMNLGAKHATGSLLHFVHADAFPPTSFTSDIQQASVNHPAGCFRSLFDTQNKFLKFNSYFTRFSGTLFRGGGQTLFIKKNLFDQLTGYDEELTLMEEYDFIQRIKQKGSFKVIQKDVLVSPRDYEKHGHFLLQAKYAIIFFFFFSGFSKQTVKQVHQKLVKKGTKP